MKALKFTFLVVVLTSLFTSCVKEDLNDDDQLLAPDVQVSYDTGGGASEQ